MNPRTTNRKTLARKAVIDALHMRQRAECGLQEAVCVYGLAESLGVEVRFLDIPSMEGMYLKSPKPHIFLSSLRPLGRRAFTCAHELAHHNRGDSVHIDEFVEQREERKRFDPKEFAADCFAGALLMPKTAVERAFALREWTISTCNPAQVYVISNYFGVGYTTLIHHLRGALSLISTPHAKKLLKVAPRKAQALALGWQTSQMIWIVDRHWTCRPIDVEAGDYIFVHEQPKLEGRCAEHVKDRNGGTLLRAQQPGIGRLESSSGWSAFIRVSRKNFVGRSIFRHLEEAGTVDN